MISYITTCMGRLMHLKRTLPLLAERSLEVIVVDYSCPQQTGVWVSKYFPEVKVVNIKNQTSFDLAKARNAGASAATNPWLCFIDADIMVAPIFNSIITKTVRSGCFLRHPRTNKPGYNGFVVVSRDDFDTIGGYDERCIDYGWEDTEFYENLLHIGRKETFIPYDLLCPIDHDDKLRTENCVEKDRHKSWKRNCDLPKRYK